MKNKFSNLNILLILFLCLIGFSPQRNFVLPIVSVYAESGNTSYVGTLNTDNFGTQIGTVLDKLELDDETEVSKLSDITNGITAFIAVISKISSYMQGFAFALSVCVLGIVGLKIMNSGKGNVLAFIKDRKDINNSLMCVLFITCIPFLVKGVLEFKPPSYLMSPLDTTANGSVAISDIVTTPKSGFIDYIDSNKEIFKQQKETTNKAIQAAKENSSQNAFSKIIEIIIDALRYAVTYIIYSPFLLITSLVGALSFYPVSFDTAMYGKAVYELAGSFFKDTGIGPLGALGAVPTLVIAGGLETLTIITNLLYFIVKKFSLLSIEFVCYYFGIMHLFGKDKDDVGKFLGRLAKGVIGITLFPFIVEFLLDVDGMIASSILRITGTAFPGFGIMAVLPSVSEAKEGFTVLALSILLCMVVFSLAKTFFIRRIEITLYYIASPVFFLKEMMSPSSGAIDKLTKTMVSAIFLNTVYAPVLSLINLMITLADDEGGLVYYGIVIAILLMGKDVLTNLIREFAGESASSSNSLSQFKKGLDSGGNKLATAAQLGAYGASKAYNNREDIVKGVKGLKGDGFKSTMKNVGSAALSGTKKGVVSMASMGKNKLKSEYWKKYNKLDKKFGNKNHNFQIETEQYKNEVLDRNDPKTQELELMKLKNQIINREAKNEREIEMEKVKKKLYDKYPKDRHKAEREYAKYEAVLKNSAKNHDILENYKDFQKRGNAIAAKSNMPEAVETMNEYGKTLDELSNLHKDLDLAMKEGRVDDVFKINKDIERRHKFIAATEVSISKLGTVSNAKISRDASIHTLKAIHSAGGNITPPKLEVKDISSAQHFVKSISNIPEIASSKEFAPIIAQMNESIASSDLTQFQATVEQFALTQRNSSIPNQAKGKINKELSKVFNVSSDSIRQHASVIQTGVDINAGPESKVFYKEVASVATSTTTTISDYIAVSSGSNSEHYVKAQNGVVNNVLKANTTNDIVETARTEAKLNNGKLDYGSLQTIINQNGGAKTVAKELNDLTDIAIKENEKFREAVVNTPSRADYGIPPVYENTHSHGETSSNSNGETNSDSNGETNSDSSGDGREDV